MYISLLGPLPIDPFWDMVALGELRSQMGLGEGSKKACSCVMQASQMRPNGDSIGSDSQKARDSSYSSQEGTIARAI